MDDYDGLPIDEGDDYKKAEKYIKHKALCFDMHNLLSRFLGWIWERIK